MFDFVLFFWPLPVNSSGRNYAITSRALMAEGCWLPRGDNGFIIEMRSFAQVNGCFYQDSHPQNIKIITAFKILSALDWREQR